MAGACALVLLAIASVLAPRAHAVSIENRGTTGLTGSTQVSPAAESIATVDPGEQGGSIQPGMTVERPLIIYNGTKSAVTYQLVVSQVVGAADGAGVEVRSGVREGAAAWVTVERPQITLKPGQQASLDVKIAIPAAVKPGSKPFAVEVVQNAQQTSTSGAGVAPTFSQSAFYVIELPGDAPVKGELRNAVITSAQKSMDAAREGAASPENARTYLGPGWTGAHDLSLKVDYDNNGERLIRPTGRVVVKDVFGRVVGRYPVGEFNVYPGGVSSKIVELKGMPSLGLLRATIEMSSEAQGEQRVELPMFLVVPKWFVAALSALLLWSALSLHHRWRMRRAEWKLYLEEETAAGGQSAAGDDAAQDGANVLPIAPGDRFSDIAALGEDDDLWHDEHDSRSA